MTPKLQWDRIHLVPYTAGLVTDEHILWLNDPEVVKYSEQRHRQHSLESQHLYLNTFPTDSHVWLIRRDSDGEDIGTMTAYLDRPNQLADMGLLIGYRSLWGKGYGYEAWDCVTHHLFHNGTRKIEAGMMARNYGMRRLAQKMGMVFEGIRAQHFLTGDGPMDMLQYGLRREEYR